MESLFNVILFVGMLSFTAATAYVAFQIATSIDRIIVLRVLVVPFAWYGLISTVILMLGGQPQHVLDFTVHPWQLLLPVAFLCIPLINQAKVIVPLMIAVMGVYVSFMIF